MSLFDSTARLHMPSAKIKHTVPNAGAVGIDITFDYATSQATLHIPNASFAELATIRNDLLRARVSNHARPFKIRRRSTITCRCKRYWPGH